MRDHTSEPTKKRMPAARIISVNAGFNREMRRHDTSAQMFIEEGRRTGHPVPKNKPFVDKGK